MIIWSGQAGRKYPQTNVIFGNPNSMVLMRWPERGSGGAAPVTSSVGVGIKIIGSGMRRTVG